MCTTSRVQYTVQNQGQAGIAAPKERHERNEHANSNRQQASSPCAFVSAVCRLESRSGSFVKPTLGAARPPGDAQFHASGNIAHQCLTNEIEQLIARL